MQGPTEETCKLQESPDMAEPESPMSAEAAFEAQPILTQDGIDIDVSVQSQWQDAAEAESQVTGHCVTWPNTQVCSEAVMFCLQRCSSKTSLFLSYRPWSKLCRVGSST